MEATASAGSCIVLDAVASQTVATLVESYGFDLEKSVEAVQAIGSKGDVGLAVSWLLDNGEEDRGGAVEFILCPHLDSECQLVAAAALPHPATVLRCIEGCASKENWLCLQCGEARCSRYVKQHQLQHHQETGHATALSLSDLSVWCFACDGYVHHPLLNPLVERIQALKFGEGSASAGAEAAHSAAGAGATEGKTARQMAKSVAQPKRARAEGEAADPDSSDDLYGD